MKRFRLQSSASDQLDSSSEFRPQRESKLRLNKPRAANKVYNLVVGSSITPISTSPNKNKAVEVQNTEVVMELGEVFEEEKRECAGCNKKVAATTYNSHLHHCLKRFRHRDASYSSSEDKELKTRIKKTKKNEHKESRSEDLTSESDSSARSQSKDTLVKILECPFCGKYSDNPQWRLAHMKKCARSKNYTIEEYDNVIRLQEKQAHERFAAGLPTGPAKPIANSRLTGRNRQIAQPTTFQQEDLQVAKAMSLSLAEKERLQREEDNFLFETVANENKNLDEELFKVLTHRIPKERFSGKNKKNQKKKLTPLLLLRSAEDRATIIAGRAVEILEETRNEMELKSNAFYVNWKDITISRQLHSNLESCRLWKLSTLADNIVQDPNLFYTPAFLEYESPSTASFEVRKHRRLSQIPGYKLPTTDSYNQTSQDDVQVNPTQDIIANLFNQNCETLGGGTSAVENVSECIKEDVSKMRDGFFTQIVQQNTTQNSLLSKSLSVMVGNSALSDVVIEVESEITIPCHRFILYSRCPLAYKELRKIDDSGRYTLNWKDTTYWAAMAFLNFIYAEIWPDEHYMNEIHKLAIRYQIKELRTDEVILDYTEPDFEHGNNKNSPPSNSHKTQSDNDDFLASETLHSLPSEFISEDTLPQPINATILNLINDEVDTYAESPTSGSMSPILFSSISFEKKPKCIEETITHFKSQKVTFTSKVNLSVNKIRDKSNTKIKTKPEDELVQISSEDESSESGASPVLSRSSYDSEIVNARLKAFESPATLTTSTPESQTIKKRKTLTPDNECFASLRKRIAKRSEGGSKNIDSSLFGLDIELEKADDEALLMSPYAAPDFSFSSDSPQYTDSFIPDNSPILHGAVAELSPLNDKIVLISPLGSTHSSYDDAESSSNSPIKSSQMVKKVAKKRKSKTRQKATVVTPMPHYSLLETPEITKKLKNIGVKNLGKKKGVNLLKHVFKETHKTSAKDDLFPTSSMPQPTTSSKVQLDSSPEKENSLSETMNMKIKSFIIQKKDLYLQTLQYQPVEIEGLHKQITGAGLKCSLIQLKDFLDNQCMAYKSVEVRGYKNRKKKSSSQA